MIVDESDVEESEREQADEDGPRNAPAQTVPDPLPRERRRDRGRTAVWPRRRCRPDGPRDYHGSLRLATWRPRDSAAGPRIGPTAALLGNLGWCGKLKHGDGPNEMTLLPPIGRVKWTCSAALLDG